MNEEKVINHEHLCSACLDEFATCKPENIVFGIDRDPSTAFTRDADKVLECDTYMPYLRVSVEDYFRRADEG